MSELSLIVRDLDRSIQGRLHGSVVDCAIAALAAEPDTIEELDHAMRRFMGGDHRSCFAQFQPGDDAQPWDAGIVVIDLAARLAVGKSTYSATMVEGSIRSLRHDAQQRDGAQEGEVWVNYRLSDDWECGDWKGVWNGAWRAQADARRQERAALAPLDARPVLFGEPLLKFIAEQLPARRDLGAEEAIRQVHVDWLLTERNDLCGKSPRAVLLEKQDFIGMDVQFRQLQWSEERRCPAGLDREGNAYRFAGIGPHEMILYYDLVRFLLGECWERIKKEGDLNRVDEARRLAKLRDAWLKNPNEELSGRVPESVIEHERRRLPEGASGAEAAVECDCPLCQMMAEDSAPYFWGLDGAHMDEDFAFSTYPTREDWEQEQQERQRWRCEFDQQQERRKLDKEAAESLWQRTFINDELTDSLPLAEFVPVAVFGFSAMVGEINQDLLDGAGDSEQAAAQRDTLNRLLGNLRDALQSETELLDPAINRLVDELEDLGAQNEAISAKCSDLARRLQDLPDRLADSEKYGDIPL